MFEFKFCFYNVEPKVFRTGSLSFLCTKLGMSEIVFGDYHLLDFGTSVEILSKDVDGQA